MKRAALYVRVSTQEQKNSGLSVDSQIDALEKYCEEQGYTVAGSFARYLAGFALPASGPPETAV